MTPQRKAMLLAAGAGAFGALAWLPTGLAPLLPLAFLGMIRALGAAESGGHAVRLGLVFGAVRYAVASHFLLALLRYSPLAIVFYLLAILFILPMAILESWGAWFLERRFRLPRAVGFVLIFALMEKLRTIGDLSFPADLIPHAFGTAPVFLALGSVAGPLGVTLGLGLTAVLLDRALTAWPIRWRAGAWAAAALLLWFGPPLAVWLMRSPLPASGGSALRVAIVQPSVAMEDKIRPQSQPAVFAKLKRLSLEVGKDTDLIVWPETARPGFVAIPRGGVIEDPEMAAIAKAAGVPILYGTILAEIEGAEVVALYNGAVLIGADGKVADWYGKQHLLPFVEALPFARYFGLSPRERAKSGPRKGYLSMLGNFTPGPVPTLFEVKGTKIGVLICYEGFYSQLARKYALAGAQALAVLTNDMWWGRSAFAPWHARMASSRACEFQLPVIRAANNGISSITQADGRMEAKTGFDEIRTMTVDVHPGGGSPTFYARFGDWILWLILLTPLASLAWAKVQDARRGLPLAPEASRPVAQPLPRVAAQSVTRAGSSSTPRNRRRCKGYRGGLEEQP